MNNQQIPQPHYEIQSQSNESSPDNSPVMEEEGGEKKGFEKKSGRRKINIEFINEKSRRHITFSKRKTGIMKKAFELSTLTGTQVLLLVASETGHVYTFATPKLQPLITKPEGKQLIQTCLNAPDTPSSTSKNEPTSYNNGYEDDSSSTTNNSSNSSPYSGEEKKSSKQIKSEIKQQQQQAQQAAAVAAAQQAIQQQISQQQQSQAAAAQLTSLQQQASQTMLQSGYSSEVPQQYPSMYGNQVYYQQQQQQQQPSQSQTQNRSQTSVIPSQSQSTTQPIYLPSFPTNQTSYQSIPPFSGAYSGSPQQMPRSYNQSISNNQQSHVNQIQQLYNNNKE